LEPQEYIDADESVIAILRLKAIGRGSGVAVERLDAMVQKVRDEKSCGWTTTTIESRHSKRTGSRGDAHSKPRNPQRREFTTRLDNAQGWQGVESELLGGGRRSGPLLALRASLSLSLACYSRMKRLSPETTSLKLRLVP
jgi:hypothetical protein